MLPSWLVALVAKSIPGGKISSWWLSLLLLGVGCLGMESRGWCENRFTEPAPLQPLSPVRPWGLRGPDGQVFCTEHLCLWAGVHPHHQVAVSTWYILLSYETGWNTNHFSSHPICIYVLDSRNSRVFFVGKMYVYYNTFEKGKQLCWCASVLLFWI